MPQAVLDEAVVDAVARRFDDTVLGQAVDRALELLEEHRQTAKVRRSAHEDALRIVQNEEARLIDAVKQGQQLDALVGALQKAQERRRALEGELAAPDGGLVHRLADPERLRAVLMSRAADVRGVLARRDAETRRVLQAVFVERVQFAPFNEGAERGYQFVGTGWYGGLEARLKRAACRPTRELASFLSWCRGCWRAGTFAKTSRPPGRW
jgi:hypothetical protein